MRLNRGVYITFALMLLSSLALAQDITNALARCAALGNSAERLACFDRVAAGSEEPRPVVGDRSPTPTPAKASIESASGPGNSESDSASSSSAAGPGSRSTRAGNAIEPNEVTHSVPSTPAAATAATASGSATAKKSTVSVDAVEPAPDSMTESAGSSTARAESIDQERRDDGSSVAEPPGDTDELLARVERIAQQPRGEHIVFLDNDQVWVEEFKNSYFPVEIGDSVTIRKRRFGGFRLVTDSGKTYRVKRLR